VLKEIDPGGIVKSVSILAGQALRLHRAYDDTAAESALKWEAKSAQICLIACKTIVSRAKALGMGGVGRTAGRLSTWLGETVEREGLIDRQFAREIADEMNAVVKGFGDELEERKLFVMTPQYASYLEAGAPLFGENVFESFPAANNDITNAGKCLALGCGTACVMHLMRVLEAGLRGIAKPLGIENKNDWGTYLREIDAALKRREKASGKRTPDEHFYADACAHFGNLRVAYRNRTMHVGDEYSTDRAEEILIATRAFMRHLATRFASEESYVD